MAKYSFIVLTNAVSGREEEYNDWYQNRHLRDFVSLPGVEAGQRFEVVGDGQWRFAVVYELDCEDPSVPIREAKKLAGTDAMPMSEALDRSSSFSIVLRPIGERMASV